MCKIGATIISFFFAYIAVSHGLTCEEDRSSRAGRIGSFRPQCEEDGVRYKVRQSHGSTGYSWCVDPVTGTEVEGSKVPPGSGTPHCRECEHKRNAILSRGMMIGGFVPSCTDDGFYSRVQVHGSTGYSWCADQLTGEEVEGTKIGPTGVALNCDADPAVPEITGAQATIENDQLKVSFQELDGSEDMQFVVYYVQSPDTTWNAVITPASGSGDITLRNFLPDDDKTYQVKVKPYLGGAFGDEIEPVTVSKLAR